MKPQIAAVLFSLSKWSDREARRLTREHERSTLMLPWKFKNTYRDPWRLEMGGRKIIVKPVWRNGTLRYWIAVDVTEALDDRRWLPCRANDEWQTMRNVEEELKK